ncbi:cytochrome b-c1 complex subunit Rieske, mitochondrial-like [Diorhabda sublineata]|uniref:cytochrome b-c1 complex subunit Rieske, mitochondrial-like n=1 Tax=Diorhabda sublineata TaxID=1163346 RepID=UPI0024E0AD20|nr:cytochrome b-c1 complex subunit Rieske, mitochondrial-like [Diorhabda sublineata]
MLQSKLSQKIFQNLYKYHINFFTFRDLVCLSVIRYAHTDIKVPDFARYRRSSVRSPTSITNDSENSRKVFSNLIVFAAGLMGLYATKAEIYRYVTFMNASADVLALAKIEIKLSEIAEGRSVTFKWRGRPLFVRHRTEEQIRISREVPLSILRDPATDEDRCTNPKFLVVIGVCTHLGCTPIPDAGDFGPGGYYCPCHGAHFDAAGRVRKGPAPINLKIPEHHYLNEDTLVVG